MKNILLLLALLFPHMLSAQFNTIGRVTKRAYTKTEPVTEAIDSAKLIVCKDSVLPPSLHSLSLHPPLMGKLRISSRFGKRNNPFGGKGTERHNGLDLSAKAGTPIYAMLGGTVEKVGYDSRSGNFIKLRHGNFTIAYCHLIRKPMLPKGLYVEAGTIVANVGSTGRSTGSHLHITLKNKNGQVLDPAILLKLCELD